MREIVNNLILVSTNTVKCVVNITVKSDECFPQSGKTLIVVLPIKNGYWGENIKKSNRFVLNEFLHDGQRNS